jgi:putative nucleotidyltransferase with HDIG domain
MTTDLLIESERVKASLAVRDQRLLRDELRAELIVGGAFLAAAVALPLIAGVGGSPSWVLAGCYVVAMAVAAQLYFNIGAGLTMPTQLVFVPMLLVEPPAIVPLLVALALTLGMTPAIARKRRPPSRLLHALGNSWFAWGPAVVLVLAHAEGPQSPAAVLIAAVAAQFSCDFAASIVRERLHGGLKLRELTAELGRVYLIDASLSPIGLLVALASQNRPWAPLLVAPLLGLLNVFAQERRSRLEQLIELNDAYRGTALVLGDVVEADDSYTGEHTRGVVQLTLDVAERLDLNAHQRRNVEFGALLHDVGKVAVPKSIINKPGKLDDEEWAIIKQHTIEGQRMLETVGGFMKEVGKIVRSSHERWDGGGYPDGLAGEEIPLESRICSVCDAYNAMTTTRSYRAAMPGNEACAELRRCAGRQFDPRVVDALLDVVGRSRGVRPGPPAAVSGAPAGERYAAGDEPANTADGVLISAG